MTDWSCDWPAPAKINRFLHVVGRRPDGYHRLQTLFQFVEPVDRLDFAVLKTPIIEREGGLRGVAEADDLALRAAHALRAAAGIRAGVRIRIAKRIPVGGGLGGGSSDAATTLVALNQLWGCGLSTAALLDLALALGADVPVFVNGRAAWAEGIGEQLTSVVVDEPWLVMVDPGVAVDTGAVFRDGKLTRQSAHITIRDLETGAVRNDCEPVVRRLHPAVGRALDQLGEQGPAMLTGTGGCLFARFDSHEAACQAAGQLTGRVTAWVCRASNRSPLLDRLDAERD